MLLTHLKNLDEVRDTLKALEVLSTDLYVDPREISGINVNIRNMVVPDLGLVDLTWDASTQLAEKAGIPSSVFNWLRKNQPAKAQEVFDANWTHDYLPKVGQDSKLLIRAREVDGLKVRAVLSDRYGIIDSLDLIEAMIGALPNHLSSADLGGMKSQVWLDQLTGQLNIKGIVKDMPGTDVDRHAWGLCTGNDECGRGSSAFDLLFSRLYCTNQFSGLGIGANRRSHVCGKGQISNFGKEVDKWLGERLGGLGTSFQKYWALRDKNVSPDEIAEKLLTVGQRVGLPKRDLESVVETVLPTYLAEVGSTSYAIVNSLTAFARDMEDRARQTFWEAAAGKVVQLL